MCRLFGLSAAPQRVSATLWLMDAPDSLVEQSRRDPDGTGLGTFAPDGSPVVEKQPIAAYEDVQFAREAKTRKSTTFVAHVRFATTGKMSRENTHPFLQRGRLFAHNGVIEDLAKLEAELGGYRDLVHGETDSERFFALISKHIDDRSGDVTAGIAAAARWVAETLPLYALNFILTTNDELWALRYPDTHRLFVLERDAGGSSGQRHLQHSGAPNTIRARSAHLAQHPAVVIASEQMDEDPSWRSLSSGELVHVDRNLRVSRATILERPPRYAIGLSDLGERAAAAQVQA